MRRDKHRLALAGVLVVLSVLLFATAIPGTFIIDDSSYIASITGLRDGGLQIAASAELAPSQELYGFDASPRSRAITTPVASSSPPLYAPIALPFSWLGIRGLMALQILSYAICAALVFAFTRRQTQRPDLAWLACATFVLASFTLEYAQAIWPQALAMALVMGAVDLVSRIRAGGSPWLAAAAGVCITLAAGVRYQNIVLIGTIGIGLVWVPRARRRAAVLAFVLGCVPLVFASSAMNHARYGSWNPISKGGHYLRIGNEATPSSRFEAALGATWSRVVDYSAWPLTMPGMSKETRTGALTLHTRIKKALLQSSPWAILPLLAMLLALGKRGGFVDAGRKEMLALGIVVAGTVGMFALFGYRDDGWSFNQRYFLELMPLLAAGLSLVLARTTFSLRVLGIAIAAGLTLALALLRLDPDLELRSLAVLKVPLLLALAATGAWAFSLLRRGRPWIVSAAIGIALGWAVGMQLGDDLPGSREVRAGNAARLAAIEPILPDEPSILIAYWGNKDAYGPLLLDHDILVVDPWIDEGATTRAVVDSALATGRRVFVLMPVPRDILVSLAPLRPTRVPAVQGLLEIHR